MDQLQSYLDQAIAILRDGFGTLQSNPKGLLIALAATIIIGSWGQWIPAAIISTAIYLAIEHFAPVLAGQNQVALPPLMDLNYWTRAGVLLVGFMIIIAVFFLVKRLIMGALGGGAKAAKH